ncbi:hypothetical protein EZV62_012144 [Acer yangbiense]|uniref:DNA-directed DNA polymerase n=1 Tax=Acer yangbiense TaxID=1000413 RepID=A0A5C7HUJ8_9ROSI|nr:hypothetical protein EZV62_012144 [Acer yangbiense]
MDLSGDCERFDRKSIFSGSRRYETRWDVLENIGSLCAGLNKVPLSQDAAASAYQIMSYLLLNIEIGKLTNLIPSQEDEVKDEDFNSDEYLIDDEYDLLSEAKKSQLKYKLKDLYLSFKEELLKFLKSRLEPNKYSIIQSGLTRKDYMRSKKAEISIYDRVSYKRRRVTLRVPTLDRDKRKTKVSTCVNFIHQKDAYIAMKVVEKLTSVTNGDAPIYTVHDNFRTSAVYAKHYAYNRGFYKGKFTIGYTVLKPGGDVNYSVLDTAISLYDEERNQSHSIMAEYNSKIREYPIPHSEEEIDQFVYPLKNANIDEGTEEATPIEKGQKHRYVNYITKLKSRSKERRSFIVVDTETVMLKVKDKEKRDISIQVPYAVGFLVVNPGADVGAMPDHSCETYFSEDYSSFIDDDFQERSNRMMFDFLERLAVVTSERKIRTVYFHNFGRFDGILIVKSYVSYMDKYKIKPLLRNNMIYELAVYRDYKYLFRFRDSLCVFPKKLDDLGIYWSQFNVDIENCMTLSSLAISIFRRQYYDPKSWPICIPNGNEDTFIRRGYYGGHADAYKPKGVYFSEELIYAHDKLGYTIIPLWGYLFERKPSPFADFVSTLYNNRMLAKKEGNEPMVFVYKTLMNSLYGRFGINPESVVTEICSRKRFDTLVDKERFLIAEELNVKYNIISYVTDNDSELNQHRISAVQLSAACARIHMYDYIKRDDCYYTDTYSAVLGNELPQDETSSIELGKLKLEHFVLKGCFLAPKTYTLLTQEKGKIIKHKGVGKGSVDFEWFEKQLANLNRKIKVKVESPFKIDWRNLLIKQKTWDVTLTTITNTKRKPFYVNNVWVDSKPKNVYDIKGYENLITPLLLKHQKEKFDKKENEYAQTIDSKNAELAKLREKVELLSVGKHPKEPVMSPLSELQPPTHYKPPTKVKKKKRNLKNPKVDKNAKKQNPNGLTGSLDFKASFVISVENLLL